MERRRRRKLPVQFTGWKNIAFLGRAHCGPSKTELHLSLSFWKHSRKYRLIKTVRPSVPFVFTNHRYGPRNKRQAVYSSCSTLRTSGSQIKGHGLRPRLDFAFGGPLDIVQRFFSINMNWTFLRLNRAVPKKSSHSVKSLRTTVTDLYVYWNRNLPDREREKCFIISNEK